VATLQRYGHDLTFKATRAGVAAVDLSEAAGVSFGGGPDINQVMPLRHDRVADRYRLLRKVGAGGMGTVWEAEDERLGRHVAVKLLHVSDENDGRVRFLREAQVGATLSHQSIVTVYDVLELDEGIALIMEYVEGQNLRERLRAGGRLPPHEAIAMLRPVASALDVAHARGVVHRDVKPANILLGKDGRARLTDLGIAFLREGTRLTRTGEVMGTAPYMPPEQLERGAGSPAGDVYALGAVAFEALSGKKARRGRTPMEVALEARNGAPPDLAAAWAGATPAAAEVLKRAMAPETDDRPGSASEVVDDLADALGVSAAGKASAARAPRSLPTRDDGQSAPRVAQPRRPPAGRRRPRRPADTSLRTQRPEPPPPGEARRPELPPPSEPRRSPRSLRRAPAAGLPSGRPAPRAAGPSKPRRRPALLALAAFAAVALIVALVATGTLGGSSSSKPSGAADMPRGSDTHATKAKSSPATSSHGPSGPSATPEAAVRSFYELAARGETNAAWHLAGFRMRAAFGNSVDRFRTDLGSLKSITFQKLSVTNRSGDQATLQVQTVARHTDHTDHCTGTLAAVRKRSGWRVEPNGLQCSSTP
jgi:serine/threonine protein kinase